MQIKKIAVSAAVEAALAIAGGMRRPEGEDQECLHQRCDDCEGTGRKKNGETCVHYISCPCPIHSVRM